MKASRHKYLRRLQKVTQLVTDGIKISTRFVQFQILNSSHYGGEGRHSSRKQKGVEEQCLGKTIGRSRRKAVLGHRVLESPGSAWGLETLLKF